MMARDDKEPQPGFPWSFQLTKWYAYTLAAMFLLYGGVKLVLGFLDRTYGDVGMSALFLLAGLALVSVAAAYGERRTWGWYGVIAINALVVVLAMLNLRMVENLVLLALSAAALVLLFFPATKACLRGSAGRFSG